MKSISLLFAVHNHQPVGNLPEVFQQGWEKCYDPFLRALEKHPLFRVSLHYSGSLLEWLEENRPEFLSRLRALVDRGQVELLSGGFYEPLLPFVPEKDAVGQVQLTNHYLTEKFKSPPRGFWLAERIWSPFLPKTIAPTGLQYTLVDDSHFRYAGFSEEDLFGYYVTEFEGFPLSLFPIHKRLRYAIPFRPPEDTLEMLRFYATDSGHLAITYADDGEKFGMWPETYRWVYEEGWLEKFIRTLEENLPWVHLLTFSEYTEKFGPQGRAYLPAVSYEEMMEWTLPPLPAIAYADMVEELKREGRYEKYWPYLRGGIWENFLIKYTESNHMHKRMLFVSQKVHRALAGVSPTEKKMPPPLPLRLLWKGQASDAYWHGLFGGIQLNYLRHAVWQNLIEAERSAEALERGEGQSLDHEFLDLDKDLYPELILTTRDLGAILKPHYGGSMIELDYRPVGFNLTNVLTRKPEAYHRKLKKVPLGPSPSLRGKEEEGLFYDWYHRYSFLDHFLGPGTTFDQFRRCQYPELGDFINQPYELKELKVRENPEALSVLLQRQGGLWIEERRVPMSTSKCFLFFRQGAKITVEYEITNQGPEQLDLWFGVEMNMTLLAGHDPQRSILFPGLEIEDRRLAAPGVISEGEQVRLRDGAVGFEVCLHVLPRSQIWHFPLETLFQSESGIRKAYQGTVFLFHWQFPLKPGGKKPLTISLSCEGIRPPG